MFSFIKSWFDNRAQMRVLHLECDSWSQVVESQKKHIESLGREIEQLRQENKNLRLDLIASRGVAELVIKGNP